jgi:serpin B
LARFTANGVQRAASATNAPVGELAPGITEFGYRLSRQTALPSKNWVASPLSIAYAFAMARAGASGETAAEIDRVFGFPPSGTDETFNAATSEIVIGHGESPQPSAAPGRR